MRPIQETYMINLQLSPFICDKSTLLVKCHPTSEDPSKARLFSIKETDKLDGDIYFDDQISLDKDQYIQKYYAWFSYTPSKENLKEFHVNDLNKLKTLIGKTLAGDI